MNTIIEKIRAEVERRKGICTAQIKANPGQTFPFVMEMTGYDKLLSVLSDLEKECEKPTNIDFEQELYKHFGQVKDFTLGMQIGKYFYELGKQEKPTTAEGLDVTDFCKPIDPSIAQCVADHLWEMLGEDEKPTVRLAGIGQYLVFSLHTS